MHGWKFICRKILAVTASHIRESLEEDWFYDVEGRSSRSFLVAQKSRERKKALCIQSRSACSATHVHHFQFRPFHFSPSGLLLFFSLFVRRFSRVPFHASRILRHIRRIALYSAETSHRVRQRSLVYSIKNGFSSPIFFLVALGYTLCAILARLIIFQKSHINDNRDILAWVAAGVDVSK